LVADKTPNRRRTGVLRESCVGSARRGHTSLEGMAPPGRRHDLEELLAGSRWVRELARGLVRDTWSADDLAQDAWVAALSRPGPVRDPRAWIAGVVRHLARREARSGERRQRRESLAARAERVPSTDELVERSELQERLSAAVRDLDEPYRTTVLLHYAEGLSLEDIARTQRVPSSTVRTRLARALERLRQRLDREHGDRATWLAAFAPLAGAPALPALTATSSVALGSLTMGAKTVLGIAAAAAGIAVLAGTFAMSSRSRDAFTPAPVVKTHFEVTTESDPAAVTMVPPDDGRQLVPIPDASSALAADLAKELAPPASDSEAALWGSVLDLEQEPIESTTLTLTDSLGKRMTLHAFADGSYSASGLATGRWHVQVGAEGFLPIEAALELEPGAGRVRRDFQLERLQTLIVKVLTPDGRPFHDAASNREGEGNFPLIAVATREAPAPGFASHRGSWQQRFGAARHASTYPTSPPGAIAELELLEPLPLHVSVLFPQEVLGTQLVQPGQTEVTFVFDVEALAQHFGTIELTVVHAESGSPIANARCTFVQPGSVGKFTSSDAAGKIHLHDRAPGQYDFYVLAEGRESARFWIDVPPGGTVERTIALASTVEISGRVVDELGQPFATEIHVAPLPEPGEPSALSERAFEVQAPASQSDGTFELKGQGPGQLLLQCRDPRDFGDRDPVIRMSANVVVDTRNGPVNDLVVRVEPAGTAVVSWLGADRADVKLRFLDAQGMVRSAPRLWSNAPQRVALPRGEWTVRVLDGSGMLVAGRGFTLGDEPVVLELAPDG
jgi:RNA polymerase sigma-70 factor (ECF subfamily)